MRVGSVYLAWEYARWLAPFFLEMPEVHFVFAPLRTKFVCVALVAVLSASAPFTALAQPPAPAEPKPATAATKAANAALLKSLPFSDKQDFEDAQKGRIVFGGEGKEAVTIEASGEGESGTVEVKTPEGSARFSAGSNVTLPDWIPEYPDAEITGNFSMQNDKTDSGSFSFTTQDSIDEVISFYEDGLKESGLKVSTNLVRQEGKVTLGTAVGEGADKKQSAYVNAQAVDSGTQVTVTFQITK